MNDLELIAIGRQFIEFVAQKEQLYRRTLALDERIKELEKAAEAPKEG